MPMQPTWTMSASMPCCSSSAPQRREDVVGAGGHAAGACADQDAESWSPSALMQPHAFPLPSVRRALHHVGSHRTVDLVVDHHHRGQRAGAEAGHGLEGVFEVGGRLAVLDAQDLLDFVEQPGRALDVASGAPAHLDDVAADRRELELGVERGDAVDGGFGDPGERRHSRIASSGR